MEPTTRGATPVSGRDDNRRKGLLWLGLAALLLLAVLAAVLIARRDKHGDGVTSATARTTTTSPSATSAPVTTPTTFGGSADSAPSSSFGPSQPTTTGRSGVADPGATTGPAGDGSPPAKGSVMSGTTPLLPSPSAGFASFVGEDAKGDAVSVESVVADEGFWVGTSPTDRLFVHLDVASESRQQVRAGQRVSFDGTVRKLTQDPAQLGLDPDEGATQLKEQGTYVVAHDLHISS